MPENGKAERDCCGNCRYAGFDIRNPQSVQCRFDPPKMFMIGMAQPRGPGLGGPVPMFVTEFPGVKRDQWCGKWSKRTQTQQAQDALPPLRQGGESMPIPQAKAPGGPPPDESMNGEG